MTKKRFKFKRFDVDIANIDEMELYEIDNNPNNDLDESNLFYVYSTTDANVQDIVDKLNSQEERINELELENEKHIGNGEWDIRDITYGHGKFRLEEWGERYHQFYDGDNPLEDETVVSLLFEDNKLKQQIETLKEDVETILDYVLHKGKFAMTVKEQKAHNRLRAFVRGDME